MHARSRDARHLFCSICGGRPPKFVGETCNACAYALERAAAEAHVPVDALQRLVASMDVTQPKR